MQAATKLGWALAFLMTSATLSPYDQPLAQEKDQSVLVTGCIERDAAATTTIYKLIESRPKAPATIYQLNAPDPSVVAAAVGKMAKVTGVVSLERRAGRDVRVLTIKAFEVVADRCQ